MRTNNIPHLLFLAIILLSTTAFGQIIYQQPASANLGFQYHSWELSDSLYIDDSETLTQIIIPLSGFMPIRDNFEARYYIANASNELETSDGTIKKLSGMSDFRIQLSHSFSDDRYLASLGINLPTGKQKLDTLEERDLIEFLSRDYVGFPLRRYGEGLGVNMMLGGAKQFGRFKCGLSALYQYSGEYEPYLDRGKYNPGDIFSITANTNVIYDKIVYTADFVMTTFGRDQLDGADIYKSANSFDSRITATFHDEPYLTQIGIRMIFRGRNNRYNLFTGLLESQLKKYGNEFQAFALVKYLTSGNLYITAHISTRKISASEEDLTRSSVFDFGLNFTKAISKNINLDIGGVYHTGSTKDDKIDINGFQLSTGLSVAL